MGTAATNRFDVIVIGAGMAGASIAAELSADRRVLLLEQENRPGYHTTGRSAALFTEAYGPPPIRALSRASRAFYLDPQSQFVSHPLLRPRDVIFIARGDQAEALDAVRDELADAVRPILASEALARMPLLRSDYVRGALLDSTAADIDVDALHQHYLKSFRAQGGIIQTSAPVAGLTRIADGWAVHARGGEFTADIVVNAAGAWADVVASMAGVRPVGLVPKRRTALIVPAPEGAGQVASLPMVVDAEEHFYLKPDAGRLLLSPADETPSPPMDAQPEEIDVAICIDRIETAFDLSIRRIEHKWAGLRSFVADKVPVVGYSETVPGFFWLAGQGGYGIQSAPALARCAACMLRGEALPEDVEEQGVTLAELLPGRLESSH